MKKVRTVGNRLITLPLEKVKNSRICNNIHFTKTHANKTYFIVWGVDGELRNRNGRESFFKITKFMNKREKFVELKEDMHLSLGSGP